eukprot:341639-Chlamydomonas_euryale.AAC.1
MVADAAGGAAGDAAPFYAKRLLRRVADGGSKLRMTFAVACLEALSLAVGGKRVAAELSRLVADPPDESVAKLGHDGVELLVRTQLLSLPELDAGLAKALVTGRAQPARASWAAAAAATARRRRR